LTDARIRVNLDVRMRQAQASKRNRSRALVSLLAAMAGLASCAREPPRRAEPARPDILLVTVDTLRADHCSTYGYDRPTTPRLTALAARGVQFDVAYSPMATTAPAHATLMTGLLPRWHGLVKNGLVLARDHPTLAEVLAGAGYRTAAVVSSFVLDRRFGLDRGFATYDDRFSGQHASLSRQKWQGVEVDTPFDRRADETRGRALEWLGANGYLQRERPAGQPPFFLWVHFFDPHYPYDPPPEHAGRFPARGGTALDRDVAAYDGEIHFTDEQIGALADALAAAGVLDRTLLVVTADHGEGLMQHGHMQHGLNLYEEAVRIPLVVRWPGGLSPRHVSAPAQLADLAPTLAEVAGARWSSPAGQGRPLRAVMAGREPLDPRREVFFQRRHYEGRVGMRKGAKGEKYALRVGRWKYIESRMEGTAELYDLQADPAEAHNLMAAMPAEAAGVPVRLAGWLRDAPVLPPPVAVGEEDARKLRSLGYVQ
jgi:choline-sulfatase